MGYAKVQAAQTLMLDPHIIDIEVDLSRGLHSFTIVGLPDKAVEESRDRVGAAIKNSGLTSPKQTNQKVVISLAPANLKKEGPNFDLGIALGYLLAREEIDFDSADKLFLGELALDGGLRPIKGILPLVRKVADDGYQEVYIPKQNAKEAALIEGVRVIPAGTLKEVIHHLSDSKDFKLTQQPKTKIDTSSVSVDVDFSDVQGQGVAKRALEIAAAGGHNVAMFGPPGTGKTMLARAFCGILPPLSYDDILEVTGIHSTVRPLGGELITSPPFRSPHHTSSYVALVGGGTYPKPGEVTLAHKGVLFLDEFPEFDKRVIETLRQPLEDRYVSISRSKGSAKFPANFILIAAMNPYPRGHYNEGRDYSARELARYRRKISGPIVDRIDLWVEVPAIDHEKLTIKSAGGDGSQIIRKRVQEARERQKNRLVGEDRSVTLNSEMTARFVRDKLSLKKEVKSILNTSARKLDLSARSYHRVLKVARTIADLEKEEEILKTHILEALQYRPKVMN